MVVTTNITLSKPMMGTKIKAITKRRVWMIRHRVVPIQYVAFLANLSSGLFFFIGRIEKMCALATGLEPVTRGLTIPHSAN